MTVHWIPEGYPPVAPYLVVQDAHGNQWWIATRLEVVSDAEIQRRMDEQAASGAA